jgi:hypothetical protein
MENAEAAALVVVAAAGLLVPKLAEYAPWLIWAVMVPTAVGVVLHLASRTHGERRPWLRVPQPADLTVGPEPSPAA